MAQKSSGSSLVLVSLAVVGVSLLERLAFVLLYVALLLFFGFPSSKNPGVRTCSFPS